MMKSQAWKFQGGLDLTTQALMRYRRPGSIIGCMNYESRSEGYRRIDGYERYDGRKSPSDDFSDPDHDRLGRIEARRDAIGEVPGQGDILGVWRYADKTYAFRRSTAGAPAMWESSASGWQEVDLGYRCEFSRGSGRIPSNGETLESVGGTESTVIGLSVKTGNWVDGNAAGFVVLSYTNDTDARYRRNSILTVSGESGRTVQIETAPVRQGLGSGAKYQFENYNFYGRSDQGRMYGVTGGTGRGNVFEFDGQMFLSIDVGVSASHKPLFVKAHQNHLFVFYSTGNIIHSNLGDPRGFQAIRGASEFSIGDEITGALEGYRDTLIIFGRNKTAALLGTSAANWELRTISHEAGAMSGTSVMMDEPVCLDDRGVRSLSATQAYGDLDVGTISDAIRPLLDSKRDGGILPVAAVRVRRKSQYRIFFSDGECIVVSYVFRGRSRAVEFTISTYDVFTADIIRNYPLPGVVTSVCSVEDSDGRERLFAAFEGSAYVYELDRGPSFDGHRIQAYLRFPYNDFGRPDLIKRYRKLLLECDSVYTSKFRMSADFHDDREPGNRPGEEFSVSGPRSYWDEQAWSEFDWDGIPTRTAESRVAGRGRNVSLVLFSEQTTQPAHVFSGVTVFFDERKMKR